MFGWKKLKQRIKDLEKKYFDLYVESLKLKTKVDHLLYFSDKKCDKCGK